MSDKHSLSKDSCYQGSNEIPELASVKAKMVIRKDGRYFRNTRFKREFSKRFQNDNDGKFGFKIKGAFLSFDPPDEMSVNCEKCTCCIQCSPILQTKHPKPPRLDVAIIDIELLREKYRKLISEGEGDCELPTVQYAPSEKSTEPPHPGNPCHFNMILDVDADTDKILLRRALQDIDLDESIGNIGQKLPQSVEQQEAIYAATKLHDRLIAFHQGVISETELQQS